MKDGIVICIQVATGMTCRIGYMYSYGRSSQNKWIALFPVSPAGAPNRLQQGTCRCHTYMCTYRSRSIYTSSQQRQRELS